ncbi:MAG TPA: arylsulfotransferase family protein [Candidatus Acidoferrales bacterium]|nr:arylsulfotransferase family protein [Candidatus Acidoferrales bacterium]
MRQSTAARKVEATNTLLELAYWTAFVLSFGFLCFVCGFVTTTLETFPYPILRNSFMGLQAMRESMTTKTMFESDRVVPVTWKASGVTRYDSSHAYNGYTLFATGFAETAYLVDMHGRLVHEWHLPFSKVWNSSASVRNPPPEAAIHWRNAFLYPNGDLLAVYIAQDQSPWGQGLVKMDRDSKPIWSYLEQIHHEVSVGPDGRVYALSHTIRTGSIPELPDILAPSLEDFIVVLSPDGKLLKRVSLYDAFARSRFRGVTSILRSSIRGDTMHTNAVYPLPEVFLKEFPFATVNTVLVSCRNLDALMMVDLDSERVTWVMRGPWVRQHDPEPLPNGNILLFDNVGDLARGGRSRVLEFEPNPLKIVWEFPGGANEDLWSSIGSAVQKLPNGNVLITERDNARLLEVTPDKKVVWEYRNPLQESDPSKRQYVGVMELGRRFAKSELAFDFNKTPEIEN